MCGYTCIRYLVFFFNVIFFITGCGLVGTGAYLRVEEDDYYLELCNKYSWATGANILIAAGVIVLVVAFFGCYGAWKQSSCMLGIFFTFLLIIFVIELAAGIYSAIERNKVEDELQSCLNGTFVKHLNNNESKLYELWNKFQTKFDCCGVNGEADYIVEKRKPPPVCDNNKEGCYDKFESDVKRNLVVVIGVGIGFAVIQILGMIMSLWLICQIKGGGGEMA